MASIEQFITKQTPQKKISEPENIYRSKAFGNCSQRLYLQASVLQSDTILCYD